MCGGTADAVVMDRQPQSVANTPRHDVGATRAGVFSDVGKCFADDEVRDCFDRRVAAWLDRNVKGHRHWRATGKSRQRCVKSAVSENSGVQTTRQIAQLDQCVLGVGVRLVEQHPRRFGIVVVASPRPTEIHRQRNESLLRAIVQIAFDPTTLGLGSVDDSSTTALKHIYSTR
jgi:hypothetical protein